MRAWQIASFGVESLQWVERPLPEPGPGEVRVSVRAVSLNYRDLLIVKGAYNPRLRMPRIPCSDGAGLVEAVGPDVSFWKPGDRVAGLFLQNWFDGPLTPGKARGALGGDVDGMLAESVVLPETGLISIPDHMSFEEASTLPCAALTAWNALKVGGGVQPGSTVLLLGSGGVSIFALQMARLRGARVLCLSASDEKLNRAYRMGLDAGLNYLENPEWDRWALDETGGRGVDLVVETGGLATLPRSLRALRVGGAVALVGERAVQAETDEALPLATILHKQARLEGVYAGSRADFEEMLKAVRLAVLRPVGENFSWSLTREALARLEEGSHFGKLVLTID